LTERGPEAGSEARLPRDPTRTLLAALAAALTLGGWVFAIGRADVRAALGAQPAVWWVQQLILLGQPVACVGLVLGAPRARRPASVLTGIALIIGTVAWVRGIHLTGRYPIPLTALVNALLLWRLTRRGAAGGGIQL